jgi:hypothetical protein
MTQLNANIPASLYKQIESLAARENISIEQLVAMSTTFILSFWGRLRLRFICTSFSLDDKRLFGRKIQARKLVKIRASFG